MREYKHTPKHLRTSLTVIKPAKVEKSEIKDLRTVVANLFHGTTYKGPYVKVTHKQAFEAREAKRQAAHEAAELAAGAEALNEIIAKDDSAFRTIVEE